MFFLEILDFDLLGSVPFFNFQDMLVQYSRKTIECKQLC